MISSCPIGSVPTARPIRLGHMHANNHESLHMPRYAMLLFDFVANGHMYTKRCSLRVSSKSTAVYIFSHTNHAERWTITCVRSLQMRFTNFAPISPCHRNPRNMIHTLNSLHHISNMCAKIRAFLIFSVWTVLIMANVAAPIALLVFMILNPFTLSPAMCEIQKVLPKHRYDFFVTPNNSKSDPFTLLSKADKPGFKDYKKGQIIPCFWGIHYYEYGRLRFIKLRNNKKRGKTFFIIVSLIWIAINLVVFVKYCHKLLKNCFTSKEGNDVPPVHWQLDDESTTVFLFLGYR